MKNVFAFFCTALILFSACQKPATSNRSVQRQGNVDSTGIDSTGIPSKNYTYEVLTSDSSGWFGIWNAPDGLTGTDLDSITFGSPVYLSSGWKYTFSAPAVNFQPFISVASRTYDADITVNLYRDGKLMKSGKNDPILGVARLMVMPDSIQTNGTTAEPILTYEVKLSDPDTTKYQYNSWIIGNWNNANGTSNSGDHPVLSWFAIPSGWKYSFKPNHLPFTMLMQASPYTQNGNTATINFYVNGVLVKTTSGRDWIYPPLTYSVQ